MVVSWKGDGSTSFDALHTFSENLVPELKAGLSIPPQSG